MATEVHAARAEPSATTASPLDRRVRLTVDRIYQWLEAGLIHEKEPIYLWKGWLVEKMTKNPPHSMAMSVLNQRLVPMVPAGWHVAPECPVILDDESMPEPDLSVVRGHPMDYKRRAPSAGHVALLIEVADSSLPQDRGEVLREYARAGIPIYWIVNIPERRVEVYTEPSGPAEDPNYHAQQVYGAGEHVPVVLDGREVGQIAVDELFA